MFTVFTSSFPWQPENGDMTVSSIIVSHRQLSSRCHAVSRTEKLSWENDDKWRGKTNISLAVTCSLIRAAVSFVTVIVTRHSSSVTNTWHKVKYVMETQPTLSSFWTLEASCHTTDEETHLKGYNAMLVGCGGRYLAGWEYKSVKISALCSASVGNLDIIELHLFFVLRLCLTAILTLSYVYLSCYSCCDHLTISCCDTTELLCCGDSLQGDKEKSRWFLRHAPDCLIAPRTLGSLRSLRSPASLLPRPELGVLTRFWNIVETSNLGPVCPHRTVFMFYGPVHCVRRYQAACCV